MKKMQIYATRDQIEDLKNSVLWNDIVSELETWKEGFGLEQDMIVDNAADTNPSTASVLMHLGDLNGRRKAVDYMLSILDVFLDIIEMQEEEKLSDSNTQEEDSDEG